ncbi:hypothetical protein MPSYJ_30070 [Mycolicibacterium psychrotolerans]|uniref:Dioxygenase n=1 Tax=Mycolicibacterium psychrotolerans TaxID=216929 RepID=A0A7I7MBR6_9MYCO|nr:hypothetical protein MPSYJ_30070 [Mycolicibacterium psychrotolerans]
MPAVFLSHGAPPLVDDALWVSQLRAWAGVLPVPTAILVVSAHWEAAPLTIGSTDARTPLTYDFWGFPDRYYDVTYDAPGAPELAVTVRKSFLDDPSPGAVPSGWSVERAQAPDGPGQTLPRTGLNGVTVVI